MVSSRCTVRLRSVRSNGGERHDVPPCRELFLERSVTLRLCCVWIPTQLVTLCCDLFEAIVILAQVSLEEHLAMGLQSHSPFLVEVTDSSSKDAHQNLEAQALSLLDVVRRILTGVG